MDLMTAQVWRQFKKDFVQHGCLERPMESSDGEETKRWKLRAESKS